MTGIYVQVAAALAFVILLIVAAGFVLKKRQNRFGLMSVVSYQPFGAKKGVAALKVGKEVLIIGVSPNDLRLMKTFGEEELDLTERDNFQNRLEKMIRSGAHKN